METKITPPAGPLDAEVEAPPSKAVTQRALFIAALAEGDSVISNPLLASDQEYAMDALECLGADFQRQGDDLLVSGFGGRPRPSCNSLFAGRSGLNARMLTSVLTLCPKGEAVMVDGPPRLRQRPFGPLLAAIKGLGGRARSTGERGLLPIEVKGGGLKGGRVMVEAEIHTEFLSSMLIVAPYASNDVSIASHHGLRGAPYLDVTLEVMRAFGVEVERNGYSEFRVRSGQRYMPGHFRVEGDHGIAAYFYAAAAITEGRVRVRGLSPDSRQGEKLFPAFLSRMGCAVWPQDDGAIVEGGELKAIEVDVRDAGELALPLAVVASFAKGKSRFLSVGHLAHREWERLASVVEGLRSMGIRAEREGDVLVVQGGIPHGGSVDPRGDFRVAMAFALAGLGARGIKIHEPECVSRVFPGFLESLKKLGRGQEG
ncbi:MAG: 3-phosphoshikimate 1-carboxyvinyltransferase [Deltaproteobacteria bacterium]|nr:3-phosphoshikimate 1-carboxyvinyltransferase [Deltaproteobacteria bacterium]